MRIVEKKGEAEAEAIGRAPPKTVEWGKEDLVLVAVIALILIGLGLGQLSIQEALAYFGVSGAGGVWGMLGGTASSK